MKHSSIAGGVQTGTAALKISMAISQKIRKQLTSRPKGYSIIPQRHVLNDVHSTMICHSQNLEIT